MVQTLSDRIRVLAERYQEAPGPQKLRVCRDAVRIMRDAGLDDQSASDLWWEQLRQLERRRRPLQ